MQTIAGYPFFSMEFDRNGALTAAGQAERTALAGALGDKTDLLVISHGWNNDADDAHAIYDELLGLLGSTRKLAVAGIFWPAKAIPDNWFAGDPALNPDGGSGGAASTGGASVTPAARDQLASEVDAFAALVGMDATQAAALRTAVGKIGGSDAQGNGFVRKVHGVMAGGESAGDDSAAEFFATLEIDLDNGDPILSRIAAIRPVAAGGDAGGAASLDPMVQAASLAGFAQGLMAGASRLLNLSTYYVMKERAGKVGNALNGVLAGVLAAHPGVRLHLAGHSFGARLVTAATAGAALLPVHSLALLQGAFSHNGFAPAGPLGFFRNVIKERRVAGPIIATHTRNDLAVGWAYAIASRASGVNASAVGDANDEYGGIGSNGAQRMGPGEVNQGTLAPAGTAYSGWLTGGSGVNNLRGDAFIKGHSDIRNPAVANALRQAMEWA